MEQVPTEETKGLADIRRLMASGVRRGMAETLQFGLVRVEDGLAELEGEPGAHAFNPYGTVHGGYAATLLDSACGLAVHTKLGAGQALATLEMKVSYLRAMNADTGRVRAIGTIVSMGGRIAFAEGRLMDADDAILATATATLAVVGSG